MPAHSLPRSRGFTLIEVLVALIVLSIGLLGVASLQLVSLRWNHGASLRSQATLLAYDIADRMRANQLVARTSTAYEIALSATKTGSSLADQDLRQWKIALGQTLPLGDGSIVRDTSGTDPVFIITVQWDDSRGKRSASDTDTTVSFVLRTQI
jgi:type IV pilus assembly protein PilV